MDSQRRMILVTSHRRENQGEPQEQICSVLTELVCRFPVHHRPAVRDTVPPRLKTQDRMVLLDPIDHFETARFLKASYLVLADSGGIQEEAPSLGEPVLVMRETTERSEGVFAGTLRLVGANREKIIEDASQLLENPAEY